MYKCTHWLKPLQLPPPPTFSLIYEGVIGQKRETKTLCNSLSSTVDLWWKRSEKLILSLFFPSLNSIYYPSLSTGSSWPEGPEPWGWAPTFCPPVHTCFVQLLACPPFCTPKYICTVQRHNTEYLKQMFSEKDLRDLSPNFHIHMSVSELYIPTIGLLILLQENMWTDPGNV